MQNTQESYETASSSVVGDLFISNPKIVKLREILVRHFSSVRETDPTTGPVESKSSRVIVFVAYRATAADLLRELSNTTGLSSIEFLTS
jgi:ERCC4-related helicase